MIVRVWRGATREEDADRYLEVLRRTGLGDYRETPGNRGVLCLRRTLEGRAELVLLTLWESEEAIRSFAGDELDRAVYYPEDEQYLLEKEERVQHFDVVHLEGWDGE